jgi:penicillin-binding protein 1A
VAVDTELPREGAPSRRPKHKAGWKTRRRLRKASARSKKRGFIRRWWWLVLVLPFLGVIGVGGTLVWMYVHLDVPKAPPPLQTTYVYDSRGGLLTTLHAAVNRTIIPLSDMPLTLQHAVIATEDQDFYSHPGIDPFGIIRAAWADVTNRTIEQGGSTITQQYVKNVYTGNDRTIARKVKEALLAIKLEQQYTKEQILSKYLNTIYFGNGAYGVEAAAKTYWRKDAKNLTILQSATLAATIAAPSTYDPLDNNARAAVKARRNYVLERMVSQGYLDAATATELEQAKVKTDPYTQGTSRLSYFTDYARRTLVDKLAKTTTHGDRETAAQMVYGGGLKVTTTLNRTWQDAAQAAIDSNLSAKGDPQAALVAIDPRNGAVRALVGGRNFQRSQVNLATGYGSPGRSAGSAFKMFTLAAAMEQKFSLNSVWSGPQSIVINDPECAGAGGAPWNPSNAGDGEAGTFTLEAATANSVNTIFAQLVTKLRNGPQDVVDVAHSMGIRSNLDPVCSITLGTQPVTPLEMTDAYATLAAQGIHHPATPLESVKSRKGQDLIRYPAKGDEALTKNQANLVTKALQGVITSGTGYPNAQLPRPAAGKTGTAQNYSDAWFCGYVPQLAACVWVGYLNDNKPLTNVEGVSPVYGGTIPAAIWHDFMIKAIQNMPVEQFPNPSQAGYTKGPSPQPTFTPTPRHTPTPTTTPTPTATPTSKHTQPTPKPTEPTPKPSKPKGLPSSEP